MRSTPTHSNDLQRALELEWIAWAELHRREFQHDARAIFDDLVKTEAAIAGPDSQLNAIRTQIADAQDRSDDGKFAESNLILQALLDDVQWTRHLAGAYIGKIHGLLGSNYFQLRQFDEARQATAKAKRACIEFEDPTGVHIYEQHLNLIEAQRLEP